MCKFTILFPKSSLLVLKISECVFDDAEELLSFYNAYLLSSSEKGCYSFAFRNTD